MGRGWQEVGELDLRLRCTACWRPAQERPMKIKFERSGGFAGLRLADRRFRSLGARGCKEAPATGSGRTVRYAAAILHDFQARPRSLPIPADGGGRREGAHSGGRRRCDSRLFAGVDQVADRVWSQNGVTPSYLVGSLRHVLAIGTWQTREVAEPSVASSSYCSMIHAR